MREPRHIQNAGNAMSFGSRRGSTLPAPVRMVWSFLRGLLEGALPIIILLAIVALFWEVMTIIRLVTAQYGFPVTQTSEMLVGIGGALVGLIVFVVAGLRTLRGVRDRHAEGDYIESTVAMVVLLISLIYVFSSLMGFIGMPQHPAP
jgi:hypothetical protein